ncbi:Beta-1,2-xylosyltransferase 1-like protein [Cladobotryum mycophilum]|uniref:Beta-1,2-xylosyltransferase 1-like protein n=1 Tax=Cladobotryum mycophilum TaxID=491253 RepID=A0ABR0S8V7_9HYPO
MFGEPGDAPLSQGWALAELTVSICILSTRYHTSAAFERPVHLTVVTLFLTGIFLTGVARWKPKNCPSLAIFSDDVDTNVHRTSGMLRHNNSALRLLWFLLDRAHRLHTSFYLLLTCIGLRTWLYWAITRTSQCSRGGLEAFLPFFTLVFEAIGPLGISPPDLQPHEFGKSPRLARLSWPSKSHLIYTFLSLAWPTLILSALDRSHIATGTVCPVGWQWEAFIPYIQLLKSGVDAVIITHCAHLIRNAVDDEVDMSEFMGKLSLAAAGGVLLLSFPGWLSDSEFIMAFRFHYADLRDLFVDGVMASFALICAMTLLSVLHSSTFALLITSVVFVVLQIDQLAATAYLSPSFFGEIIKHTVLVIIGTVPLWYLTTQLPNVSKSFVHPSLSRWIMITHISVVSVVVICWLWASAKSGPSDFSLDVAIEKLVSDSGAETGRWETQAAKSKTLTEAVTEYKRRYGIPPPPSFDKWYNFAVQHKSPIIDDFTQIHEDLLPFWGEEPAVLRAKTSQILSYESTAMGGLRIRNGTIQSSPHIPGSHRWMADAFEKMVQPFAKWLPDMDLAFNLADECRMAIPYEDMKHIKDKARKSRAKAESNKGMADWTKSRPPKSPWPEQFTEQIRGGAVDPSFTDIVRRQIFYDYIAPTCPSSSKARNSRWWDWSITCTECMRPHSLQTSSGPLVDDMSQAYDLCHQPDIAYLDGFIMSPPGMLLTRGLFPIFGQARVGGFSDILIPSPWNFADKSAYNDDSGIDWDEKMNGMFWRGTNSDGFAAHGRWVGFLRSRFVHEAYERAISSRLDSETPVSVNVSFTGGRLSKCDGRECEMELDAYELWGTAALGKDHDKKGSRLSASVPFEEHWRYRHLMDMDGAGFSGRFLPFLESHSLPYRAALFRTWYEERIRAWHHFVPVDVRLGKGFWAVLDFLSSDKDEGSESARKMAEQGREWARKALRKEDMQIYMFRLLLEWGRIVDDNREHLGFSVG